MNWSARPAWKLGRRRAGCDDDPVGQRAGSEEDPAGWLTPGVRGIGLAGFLADVGHEIPTALLPDLLTATLGAPASALGLIEGVSDGLAGAARVGGGALADDHARRRAVAVGGDTTAAALAAATGGVGDVAGRCIPRDGGGLGLLPRRSAVLLRSVCAFLVVYAVVVWLVAMRRVLLRPAVWGVVVANAIWAVDSIVVARAEWFSPSGAGRERIILQAITVGGFAMVHGTASTVWVQLGLLDVTRLRSTGRADRYGELVSDDRPFVELPDEITLTRNEVGVVLFALDLVDTLTVERADRATVRRAIRLLTSKLWSELDDLLGEEGEE